MGQGVYDLIIIGGGVSGIGVALEATKKGLVPLILEQNRLFSGASQSSLRVIHGGFRYLQQLNIPRVVSSLKAQTEILEKYPDFISPIACVFPIAASGLKSKVPVQLANYIYKGISAAAGTKAHNRILSKEEVEREISLLSGHASCGALLWRDALIIDLEGFHSQLRNEALEKGVHIRESWKVTEVAARGGVMEVRGANAGSEEQLTARFVVNTSGAWVTTINCDRAGHSSAQEHPFQNYRWCKAFNLILRKSLEPHYAVGIESRRANKGRRLYFITPRGPGSAVGTEYVELTRGLDDLTVTETEKQSFLEDLNHALSRKDLTMNDVAGVEVGALPCIPNTRGDFKLVGGHKIFKRGNFIDVLSTKYTTFLIQGREVLNLACS